MAVISMKALLESGVHFGHRTHKWHPGMKPFIFTERNGIHIIDLQKTAKAVEQAYTLLRDIVANGGIVLFVGTKRQALDTIQAEAIRCGMPYVTNRWLGGMLTNWRTIRSRVNELERLERMRDSGDFDRITKKEALILSRQIERLETLLTGIRSMSKLPDALFVVDVHREATAIHEANLLNIPVVAMVDTNCDPRDIDYIIPSNDDAIRAIKLIVGKMADAIVEGKALRKEEGIEEQLAMEQARGLVEEPELSDEELLGESTLAKLSTQAPRPVTADLMEEELEEVMEEGVEEFVAEGFEEAEEGLEEIAAEGVEEAEEGSEEIAAEGVEEAEEGSEEIAAEGVEEAEEEAEIIEPELTSETSEEAVTEIESDVEDAADTDEPEA